MSTYDFVLVGGNRESSVVLEALLRVGRHPTAIVVPHGHLAASTSDLAPQMLEIAAGVDIDVICSDDINNSATLEALGAHAPDYVFVTGWSQLLGESALAIPTRFVVGSHPSALPEGRGRAPLPWTILEGASVLVVSLFRMTRGVDDGAVLHREPIAISPDSHVGALYDDVAAALARGFVSLAETFEENPSPAGTPQVGDGSYRHLRGDVDGFLDFRLAAQDLDRLVRAVSRPYPGAWAVLGGREVRVWRSAGMREATGHIAVPGTVVAVKDGAAWIATGDGLLGVAEATTVEWQPVSLHRGMRFEIIGGDTVRDLLALRHRLNQLEAHRCGEQP